MKWIAKCITAAQALLLLPFGASKAAEAAAPSDLSEGSGWESTASAGTPEALRGYVFQVPRGGRMDDAFNHIIQQEIAAAKIESAAARPGIQLAGREPPEVLEHDFDLGTGKDDQAPSGVEGLLGPY